MPASVALVGASSKPGSIGRIVLENLLGGAFHGALYAVNPNHRRVLARRSYASLAAIGKPVDLALIAVPAAAVLEVLEDGARAGVKAAVILSAPPADPDDARRWQAKLLAVAAARGIRLLGPHSFGVIRTDIGLNATLGSAVAHPGRLALVAQSGAVCAAMLDFAASAGIGFSTVVALGGAHRRRLRRVAGRAALRSGHRRHPALRRNGRRRAALPVGAARRGADEAGRRAARPGGRWSAASADAPSPDAVFDAAMRRAGTVRVKTYAQLFAAARILAMHRISRGDRLAIVTNGHGPGTLAADSAARPRHRAGRLLARDGEGRCRNCCRRTSSAAIRSTSAATRTPARIAAAVAAALADPQVDAVLVLHVPRPVTGATDAARAVAGGRAARDEARAGRVARRGRSRARRPMRSRRAASPISTRRRTRSTRSRSSPRIATIRNGCSRCRRRSPSRSRRISRAVERIRADAASANRRVLTEMETHALLSTFGLPVAPARVRRHAGRSAGGGAAPGLSGDAALRHRRIRVGSAGAGRARTPARRPDADPRMGRDARRARRTRAGARRVIVAQGARCSARSENVAIGICTDAVFGPVITFGAECAGGGADVAVLLPPLNVRLARDMIRGTRHVRGVAGRRRGRGGNGGAGARPGAGVGARLRGALGAHAGARSGARRRGPRRDRRRARRDRSARQAGGPQLRPHGDPSVSGRAGGRCRAAPTARSCTSGRSGRRTPRWSARSSPACPRRRATSASSTSCTSSRRRCSRASRRSTTTARWRWWPSTRAGAAPAIVGVARYIMSPDQESAEFAVVVADAWHGRGVGADADGAARRVREGARPAAARGRWCCAATATC